MNLYFKPFNPGELTQNVDITLGKFDEISDSESYGNFDYDPVIYNGEGNFEVRLLLQIPGTMKPKISPDHHPFHTN